MLAPYVPDFVVLMTAFLAIFLLHRRNRKLRSLETNERAKRNRYRTPRSALVPAESSPWQYLYSSGSDSALIVVSGFNHAAFEGFVIFCLSFARFLNLFRLLSQFEPIFNLYTPYTDDGFI